MNKFVNTLVKFCLTIAVIISVLLLLLIGMIVFIPKFLFRLIRVVLIIVGIIAAAYLFIGIVSLLFPLILTKKYCKSKRNINYRI